MSGLLLLFLVLLDLIQSVGCGPFLLIGVRCGLLLGFLGVLPRLLGLGLGRPAGRLGLPPGLLSRRLRFLRGFEVRPQLVVVRPATAASS